MSMSRTVPRSRIGRTQPAGGQGGAEPLLVVVAGGALEQFGVEGPGARCRPGPVIDEDGGQRPAPGCSCAAPGGVLRRRPRQ